MPTLTTRGTNRVLWTVQSVLALLFLFAGTVKLVMPIAALTVQTDLPGAFIRFIGVLEVLGALGLILPGLFRIRPQLTPLAACGLVGVMAGATVMTAVDNGALPSLFPFMVGLFALAIALGRNPGIRLISTFKGDLR